MQINSAENYMQKGLKIASWATGLSMAFKTLGSAGFYLRNALSNLIYFGPMQGLVPGHGMTQLLKEVGREMGAMVGMDTKALDSYRMRLHALNIIGDDVNTNLISDLLSGKQSTDTMTSDLEKLLKSSEKLLGKTKKALWEVPLEKAKEISFAIDAAHKIAYFEHEMKVLKKARDHANRTVDGSHLQNRTDEELERMAAKKVLMTSQSYSQTLPIVKAFQDKWLHVFHSPFLRFKTEVPRITVNTFKLAFQEMKSGNAVEKARGRWRFVGASGTLGIMGVGASYLLKGALGFGDEEDEFMRSGVPEYARDNTFFYLPEGEEGEPPKMFDLTFVNPFAVILDPLLRGSESLLNDREGDVFADILGTLTFDIFADEQIMWGTVYNAFYRNNDPMTGHPIYESIDEPAEKATKLLKFLYRDAFEPKMFKAVNRAWDVRGEDFEEWEHSSTGVLAKELRPFKIHNVDAPKLFSRFLGEMRGTYDRIRGNKNRLFSETREFTESEIRDIAREEYKGLVRLHDDMVRKIRGGEKAGLTQQKAFIMMKEANISKQRLNMLYKNAVGRIPPSKDFMQTILSKPALREGGKGRRRLDIYLDEFNKLPRLEEVGK